MCLPPTNARICPNPLLYSAVYHRYSLKSFQLCKSAQTYWYRKYFEHIVARFQGDSSCLTIDNIKPELCRNSAPLYNPISVGTRLCTCAVLSSRKYSTPPVTADTLCPRGISTECFEKLVSSISKGVLKCCILYILFIFSFNTLDKGLDLLSLQLKWLEWKNNGAELSTTDIGLYNGAEFRQSSGFMLSMVKQLESPWNLATMCSKYFRYQYV